MYAWNRLPADGNRVTHNLGHDERPAIALASTVGRNLSPLQRRNFSQPLDPLRPRHRRLSLLLAGAVATVAWSVGHTANTAAAVIGGGNPALISFRADQVITNNLAQWPAWRIATLSNNELAAIRDRAPSAYWAIAAISPADGARMRWVVRQKVPPSVGIDSTLEEIYLDFRTAPG